MAPASSFGVGSKNCMSRFRDVREAKVSFFWAERHGGHIANAIKIAKRAPSAPCAEDLIVIPLNAFDMGKSPFLEFMDRASVLGV